MNRHEFKSQVQDFVEWFGRFEWRMVEGVSVLRPVTQGEGLLLVHLDIPKSANVSKPIDVVAPFHTLTERYSWLSRGMSFGDMKTGDFKETRDVLGKLAKRLKDAAQGLKNLPSHSEEAPSEDAVALAAEALTACQDIIIWGGGKRHTLRDEPVGAAPFLRRRGTSLLPYLQGVAQALKLDDADVPHWDDQGILDMNAMLSKVHSLFADDGLPIYDSRVAGATATIIETWRRARGQENSMVPPALTFPLTDRESTKDGRRPRRTPAARYERCVVPPYISRTDAVARVREWTSAKVRLGWLLHELLVNPAPAGMRALEACLFMAGYDCSGINPEQKAGVQSSPPCAHGASGAGGLPLAA